MIMKIVIAALVVLGVVIYLFNRSENKGGKSTTKGRRSIIKKDVEFEYRKLREDIDNEYESIDNKYDPDDEHNL